MFRLPVISKDLRSVGYDGRTSILEIEFQNGSLVRYTNVPIKIFEGLLTAESKGQFYHYFVKDHYSFHRLH